jgi:hypothetical protein
MLIDTPLSHALRNAEKSLLEQLLGKSLESSLSPGNTTHRPS